MMLVTPIEVFSPDATILLTSAGPTTEVIQEQLLEMGRDAGRLATLNVLKISDGWTPLNGHDGVSLGKRVENSLESRSAQLWTTRYTQYVLGEAKVNTRSIRDLDATAVEKLLQRTDMLLIPGGNTWQTMRGLMPHADVMRKFMAQGLPYVGESAGSIVAGVTNNPASIAPADTRPENTGPGIDNGLGLINADVVVHVAGRKRGFAIPGFKARVANMALRLSATTEAAASEYTAQNSPRIVINLSDDQAFLISAGSCSKLL